MKNKNIFASQNQTLINLFQEAGLPDKVLCIPIDYAKKTHMALCCNGSGKILKKPFPVKNTPEGIAFLLDAVDQICRKHHIKKEHVFFGGEDCGTFSLNFIYGLRDAGFLDETLSGIPPFSEASLYLMQDRFSSVQIASRQDKALLKQLKAQGLQHAEAALGKLKGYARQVLNPPLELSGLLQTSLAGEINLYRCLKANTEQIEREIAQQLAKTPGAMLTTIRGIGITLAAGGAAEIGAVEFQSSTRRLCSYAGIVPRVKQTGGPEKGAKTGKVSRRSNHILKDFIVQCGNHLGQHGPVDLKEDHRRRSANKQHADFGMARRYLRMGMRLMRNNESYVPPELRHGATLEELQNYYRTFWPKLLDKWVKAKAADTAFNENNPLGQWRKRIEALYEIELPLPPKK